MSEDVVHRTPKGAYSVTAHPGYVRARELVRTLAPAALRDVMDEHDLTVDEVAEIMGLSPSAVRHRLYGRKEIALAEVVALALELHVDPAVFYTVNRRRGRSPLAS